MNISNSLASCNRLEFTNTSHPRNDFSKALVYKDLGCEEEFNKLHSTAAIPMFVEFLHVSRSGDSAGAKTWIATRFCFQSQNEELC